MQVQRIQIKNFKLLEDVEIVAEGRSIIVLGPNNVGKSSLIDAVFDTLQNGDMPAKPIRIGADKGEIVVEVGDRKTQYIVKKSFTEKNPKGYLSISTPDGATYNSPVSHLNAMFGTINLDLEGLLAAKDSKELAKQLKAFIGINVDKELAERKAAYDERAAINREINGKKPLIKPQLEPTELLAEAENIKKEIDSFDTTVKELEVINGRIEKGKQFISDRTKEKDEVTAEILKEQGSVSYYQKSIEEWEESIRKAKEQIELKTKTIEVLEKNSKEIGEKLAEANKVMEEVTGIQSTLKEKISQKDLKELQLNNIIASIEKNEENNKLVQNVADLEKKSKEKTEEIDKIDAKIKEIYKESSTEDLTFEDDEILFRGLPLDKKQINTAGLAKLALDLAIKSKPKLHAVRFDASFMDNKTYRECLETIHNAGMQAFIEMVDKEGTELTVQIEETLI